MKKERIGTSLDDWLHEEGLYEETASVALKRVLARQSAQRITEQQLSGPEAHPIPAWGAAPRWLRRGIRGPEA
jgi:hypothetical protein